jgi:predicted Rossmann fold nucleotide-binding protein DprA/Smf involved in DNA uptake
VTLTPLFAGVRVRESSGDVEVVTRPKPWPCVPDRAKVPAVAGPCPNPAPRSTRARRLVEPFGGVQNILKASLTELEATGIQPSPHQSLGTGQSMELAHEMRRVAAGGVSVVCQDDSTYRAPLKQIYDPPLILNMYAGMSRRLPTRGSRVVGTRHPTPNRLGMAGRMACDLANRAWQFSAAWPGR